VTTAATTTTATGTGTGRPTGTAVDPAALGSLEAPTLRPMDVAGRLERLGPRLAEAGCDALLVTNLTNVRYLTGFTGSAGMVLVTGDGLLLVTDGRYGDQSAAQTEAAGVAARRAIGGRDDQRRALVEALGRGARLGLEAESVTWAQQRAMAGEWFEGVELVATSGVVEALREVKDPGEIDRLAAAARVADEAFAAIRPLLAQGPTERQVALTLDVEMSRRGASGPSFDTIVAGGPHGAMPHHRPSDRPIGAGELVVMDFGAVVDGYCSDMTRTLCVGEPADATAARMVEVVAASQAAGVAAVRAGATAGEVDATCRGVIAEAGWADAFVHSTGHGVGLEIHERPWVGAEATATLEAGHVVTVEPGVYLTGVGGVRIEDTVVVTPGGCRVLTNAGKDLTVTPGEAPA